MKKIFSILIILVAAFNSFSQTTIRANQITADDKFFPPVKDTTQTPGRVGQLTIRAADTSLYMAISITAPKKWQKILKLTDLPSGTIPTLQQVTTAGGTTNQPISSSSSFTSQVGSDYSQIQYFGITVTDATNTAQIYPADITSTNGTTAMSLRNDQINFAGSGNPSAIKLFPIYHASQTDSVYLPHKGARKDTIAYLADVRAGGGAVSLASVGGGLDIQTGGAGNIRTLYSSDFDVATNLISLDYTNGPELHFTEVTQEFTSSTSMSITLSNTPKAGKAEMYYLNGVVIKASNVSRTGTGVTLSGFVRESSDVITAKYSY